MEPIEYESSWSTTCDADLMSNTVSTLLLPDAAVPLAEAVFDRYGGPGHCLRELLQRHRTALLTRALPVAERCKRVYQRAGQRLHRRNFRPDNRDWILLGQIAQAHGVSRCFMFVMLLWLEASSDQRRREGVPTDRPSNRWVDAVTYSDRLNMISGRHTRCLAAAQRIRPGAPTGEEAARRIA